VIGAVLSHFRVAAKLGEGGMGAVYRAEDTKLGREVALKILPEAVASDPERLARFEREARMLAALNHPAIAAIHSFESAEMRVEGGLSTDLGRELTTDLGREGGGQGAGRRARTVHFLVMELAAGETLAERIARGPVPVEEAVPIARQIAEALEAAHARGIVHRDLKPANVKVDARGAVKVLDFGLAKALVGERSEGERDLTHSPTLTGYPTAGGVLLGTAAYMSPEQARGLPVDVEADVWAFGCVVYEMLAGERPFTGATTTDVLAAVLRAEPDLERLPKEIPSALRRLLARTFEKDPRHRLQGIGEARVALEDLAAGRCDVAAAVALVPGRSPARRLLWPAAAIVAGVAGLLAGARLRSGGAPADELNPDRRLRQLTFAPGLEQDPALSPDGNYVAYATDERGNLDIVVLPLAGGNRRVVVDDPADDAQPAWSPDGSQLAFVSARDRGGRLGVVPNTGSLTAYVRGRLGDLYLVPALGGRPVKLAEKAAYPSWSPDGRELVVQSDRSGQWDLWIVPAAGGEPRALTADATLDLQPAWSPDGRWIAYATTALGAWPALRVAPAGGGESRLLFQSGHGILDPAWSADGRWVYFASDRAAAPGSLSLWRLPFPGETEARPERVSLGPGDVGVEAGRQGSRLVYSAVHFAPDLWELALAGRELRQLTTAASAEDFPDLAPDGRTMLLASGRAGDSLGVWALDLETREMQQLVAGGNVIPLARWSPDGRRFAFLKPRDPLPGAIHVQELGGIASREVVASESFDALFPDWSRDGQALVYQEIEGDFRRIAWQSLAGERRVLVDGGTDRQVNCPDISLDGRLVAYQMEASGVLRQIWSVPIEGGEPAKLSRRDDLELSHPQWSPVDPDAILVAVDHENVGILSVATGEVTLLTSFDSSSRVIDYPSWAPDGERIFFSLSQRTGDVFLLEDL
jgi:Tol biopolymer transport system component